MAFNWEQSASLWGFAAFALSLHGCMAFVGWLRASKVPTVGKRSVFEAGIISNFRFYKNAQAVLVEGYTKVWAKDVVVFKTRLTFGQFKGSIFQFKRLDADMLVLPPKYVNDIRLLPSTVASPTVAHAHNLMGSHTNMNIILRNNLHFRTLQLKLTPNLSSLTDPMKDELNYAIQTELPDGEGKVSLFLCLKRMKTADL